MASAKKKAEREFEQKRIIRKTVFDMKKQIDALEEQKKIFVQKATEAKKHGLEAQYNLAITGYKMTLVQQKRAQEMLLNFEITLQMKDMTVLTKQFLNGMSVMSKEMAKLADDKQFIEVQRQFEEAMDKAGRQAERIEMFMETSQDSFASAASGADIDDSEIKDFVDQQAGVSDEFSDEAIDKEIEELKKKIEEST